MEELELTYLAKYLPDDLADFPSTIVADIYLPAASPHPTLRLRRRGDGFEMTKKTPIAEGDRSCQIEQTIALTPLEYDALSTVAGKKVEKRRYRYGYDGVTYEIDVFDGELAGLVLIDVEFSSREAKDRFTPPPFCLADVTQEDAIAGGMLCGKRYEDIAPFLTAYGYRPLELRR